jgi:hypothetical protein
MPLVIVIVMLVGARWTIERMGVLKWVEYTFHVEYWRPQTESIHSKVRHHLPLSLSLLFLSIHHLHLYRYQQCHSEYQHSELLGHSPPGQWPPVDLSDQHHSTRVDHYVQLRLPKIQWPILNSRTSTRKSGIIKELLMP